MKRTNLVVASTFLAVGLASATGVWAKPHAGKEHHSGQSGNHGQTVSTTARSKDDDSDTNHGRTVSEVARAHSKKSHSNTGSNGTSHHRYDSDANSKTYSNTKHPKAKHQVFTHSTTRREATRIRNNAVQSAQRTYKQRRAQILNDGDSNDDLTSQQREQLRNVRRDRQRAIRQAQEQYRLTLRRNR